MRRFRNVRRLIEIHPMAGHLPEDGRSREFAIPSTPFTLRYVVGSDFVGILRILDQRRGPSRLFDDDLR
jgi:plasmid stabilization system protein ParE